LLRLRLRTCESACRGPSPVLGMSALVELMMPRRLSTTILASGVAGGLVTPRSDGHPMNSTLLHGEVRESADRLIAALAEEKRANDLGADNPDDATALGRWKRARRKVLRAADYYVGALENYLEAVVSTLAQGRPAGPQWPTLTAEPRRPALAEDPAKNYGTSTFHRCTAPVHRPPLSPARSTTVECLRHCRDSHYR
jgi:hypothetical protein